MNRERSAEEGVRRGACRHSIDAAVPWYQLLVSRTSTMAFACNAQFTEDEFEHFRHISGLKTWAEAMTPVRFARGIFFQPRWEPVLVSPLLNPMKNQGSRLNSRGISAISFSVVSSELEIRAWLVPSRLSVFEGSGSQLEDKWSKGWWKGEKERRESLPFSSSQHHRYPLFPLSLAHIPYKIINETMIDDWGRVSPWRVFALCRSRVCSQMWDLLVG